MLRNVLEDYLSSIKERDFDYPLASLLQAMGYYDIHFTDGVYEFGKDFIAKKIENDIEYQYAIQSKKGDITQNKWKNEIKGQLEEAISSDLSHPQFNTNLPRKVVLVTTGILKDKATLLSQEFKTKEMGKNNQIEDLTFWDKEQLIQYFEQYGLSGIHPTTVKGLKGFAQFYLIYSKAIEGNLSDREIEEFSRLWLDESLEYRKRILRASIEADIIATKLIEGEHIYEALNVYLSLARVVMQVSYENDDPFIIKIYKETLTEKILSQCKYFFNQFKSSWEDAEKSLLRLCINDSYFPMVHYLVWCSRVLETTSLYFFLMNDKTIKDEIISFLIDFLEKEEGCGHIPGDRYATSLVWPTLALMQSGKIDKAISLVKRSVIWLCDRVEKGFGLARYEADEYEETAILVGYPFDFIKIEKNISSYLATITSDLAAFISDKNFYADVVNDIEACEIAYSYWQLPDSKAIFTIDTEECLHYPNIPHQFSINSFEDFAYAEHIKHEPQTFQITQKASKESLILLSILLKDRYFPKMWRQIITESASVDISQTVSF